MIAYYVHNKDTQMDTIVLPEMGCSVPVDADRLITFISVKPEFKNWSGDACENLSPEDFGTIIATRDESGDVQVRNEKLWRQRMDTLLGHP
jgi:hypothetical protein